MAWEKTSANGRLVLEETITLANSTGGKTQTSTIKDIAPGQDYTVIATDNDDVAAAVDVNVLIAADEDDTFVQLKADLIAGLDGDTLAAQYDNSAEGDAPYYQIEVEEDGTTAAGANKTVTVQVITDND